MSKSELQALLDKPSLRGIPLLVLGNKNDLQGALSTQDLITQLGLKVSGEGGSVEQHAGTGGLGQGSKAGGRSGEVASGRMGVHQISARDAQG